jgi:hypothetical protein
MRSDEFDKRDTPAEVESHNHSKVAAGDFEPCTSLHSALHDGHRSLNSNWQLWLTFSIDEAVLSSPRSANADSTFQEMILMAPNMFPKRERCNSNEKGGEITRRSGF